MNDSTTTVRPLSGAEEFDRRMRSIAQSTHAHSDAMAELARLVGHQDPFAAASQPAESHAVDTRQAAELDPGEEPGSPVEPAVVHAVVEPEPWERIVPRYPSISVREEPTPDQWAQGLDEDGEAPLGPPPVTAAREPSSLPEPDSSRRTLTVLAAVIVLTAGGLGASFLARAPGGSALATTTAAPPTIMAVSGPAKIQPEPVGSDAASEPSTLLDKSNSDGTATAKVVNTVEQPVDLSQAIKPAAVGSADLVAARPGAFPEPRKVKTVMVRPDGSLVADASTTEAAVPADVVAAPDVQQAGLAFDPKTTLPTSPAGRPPMTVEAAMAATSAPPAPVDAAPEVPRTASGKTTARATARPAASTSQDSAAQARSTVATPKAKPVAPRVAAKPKAKPPMAAAASDADVASAPVQVATADPTPAAAASDATPTATVATSGAGGSFAIQLGAAPSQAEGDAAAARLAQKYGADLNGATPSVRKAQAGSKTVYRIRVGGLSQDDAKSICAKVQAGGGGCFVAR